MAGGPNPGAPTRVRADRLDFESEHCSIVEAPPWRTPFGVRDCIQANTFMTETLSIRIDSETKKRLDALSKRSRRSKSFLAAEAIAAYVEAESWQLGELQAATAEVDSGKGVGHEKVSKWLGSWGKPGETKAPR